MKNPYLLIITAILYLVLKGETSLAKDSYIEALEACKQAVKMNPDDAEAHFNLGVVYYQSDKNKEAIESFKQSIKIDPDDAAVHFNLGVVYFSIIMFKEAIESFKQSIKINPDYAKVYHCLGGAYGFLGMYKDVFGTGEMWFGVITAKRELLYHPLTYSSYSGYSRK